MELVVLLLVGCSVQSWCVELMYWYCDACCQRSSSVLLSTSEYLPVNCTSYPHNSS